ncbi:hypothetical protein NKH14_23030 [Mesorhizobium sp. M1380]|uniref:hypothetical protein n=1 Tax=Mesorhizobium sp. M1380 TaxID=2957093 RepID=UPI003335091D
MIDKARFEPEEWKGVDLKRESIWKDGAERKDSIQWHMAQIYVTGGYDVVCDDDESGEAADLGLPEARNRRDSPGTCALQVFRRHDAG